MARGNPKGGRAWHPQKRSPGSRDRRFWDLGADLDQNGALRIYRKPSGASALANKGLVIHQMDTEKNPEGLEIIQEGTGHSVSVRMEAGGTVVGGFEDDGTLIIPSSAELKDNHKNIGEKVAEKILGIKITSWEYNHAKGRRQVGPTAEDFKKITGYGDGETINQMTFLGLTFRVLQMIAKKVEKLEKRLGTEEADEAKKAKKSLENGDDLPKA